MIETGRHICSICEAKVELGGRIDERSMKYHLSTLQGGEDYQRML